VDASNDKLKRIIAARLTDEMLEALDFFFPEKSPGPNESLDHIRYASGQRSVVRFLHALIQSPESSDL
jgi:hypothetical protein